MKILYPEFLWFFTALPPLFTVYYIDFRRGKKYLSLLGIPLDGEFYLAYRMRSFVQALLLAFFFSSLILSLIEIKWGSQSVVNNNVGLDAAIVLDVSNSMLAEDVDGGRLERCKDAIRLLIGQLEDARFSLVLFKGEATTFIPLTDDRAALINLIDMVGPTFMTSPGSDLEAALLKGRASLPDNQERNRALFLFTDGEALLGDPFPVARELDSDNIQLFTFGVGKEEPAPIPLGNGNFMTDEWGRTVYTSQQKSILRELSRITGAEYSDLSIVQLLGVLDESIVDYYGLRSYRGVRVEGNLKYRLFLLLGIGFLIAFKYLGIKEW